MAFIGSQFALENASASSRSVYEIGNSLTADVYQNGGFAQMVQSRGHSIAQGRTIRWGMGLATQWADYLTQSQSTSTTTIQGGFFQNALTTQTYDAITVQPFANSLNDEVSAARQMIDFAHSFNPNAHADLFLYAPWPGLDFQTGHTVFSTQWQADYPNAATPVGNFPSRRFFERCYESLRAENPQNRVFLIPTGEVFEALSYTISVGGLPGVNADTELYNDSLHASAKLGRFVAAVTWYTTLFRDDPHGMAIPAVYEPTVTPAVASVVYDTVWHVLVSQAQRTNVWSPGDVTGNGIDDFDDLLVLAQNYSRQDDVSRLQGDVDENGIINFDDLLILAQHYKSASSFASDWTMAQSIVPEPAAIGALMILVPVSRRRYDTHRITSAVVSSC